MLKLKSIAWRIAKQETTMANLVAIVCPDQHRAAEVMATLRRH